MKSVLGDWLGSLHLTAQTFGPATRTALDTAIGVGALTWPWWVQMFDQLGYWVTLIGGIVLLGLRILVAWKEWRK